MSAVLDYRATQMRDLTAGVCRLVRKTLLYQAVLLGGLTIYLIVTNKAGASAFALISVGSIVGLGIWASKGIGVPLMPMILVQQIFLYAVPILVNPALIASYPEEMTTDAGLEVLVFSLAFAGSWVLAMNLFQTSPPICFALAEFKKDGAGKLRKLSLYLIVGSTLYLVLDRMGLMSPVVNALPVGTSSILVALLAACAACGFFIGSLLIGSGELSAWNRQLYWGLLAFNIYFAASAFLLSAACTFVMSVVIGLFWSSGKIPWRLIVVLGVVFSFLNVGKDTMRDRYWRVNGVSSIPDFQLGEMPALYVEWFGASVDALTGGGKYAKQYSAEIGVKADDQTAQTLLVRVNNLQNLLYVIDAVTVQHIEPMHGDTYTIIPLLLVPRILIPDKPRSHQGQIMLNVHFLRQDLHSTLETYVAWGLLPEAYGNFGPWLGSIVLGCVLGVLFAWLEKWTANKLVVSLEGFVGFTIFLGITNAYEMVASVLVTTIFQALVPVTAAMLPFSHWTRIPGKPNR